MLEQNAQSHLSKEEPASSDPTQRLAAKYAAASLPAARFARLVALADALVADYLPEEIQHRGD